MARVGAYGRILVDGDTLQSDRGATREQPATLAVATIGPPVVSHAGVAAGGLVRLEQAVREEKRSTRHINAASGRQSPSSADVKRTPSRTTMGLIRLEHIIREGKAPARRTDAASLGPSPSSRVHPTRAADRLVRFDDVFVEDQLSNYRRRYRRRPPFPRGHLGPRRS